MLKINFSTVYNRKNKLNKQGEALIHIRANQKGKSIYFSTDITIKPLYWNEKKLEIRNSHPHHITINRELESFRNKLIDLSEQIKKRKKIITLELLKEAHANTSKYNDSFLSFYENELEKSGNNISTYANQKSTLNRLKEFRKELLFSEIDFEFLTDFTNHCQNKELHRNTINKYVRHIKTFVNLAINKNLIEAYQTPFSKFKYPTVQTRRKFINSNEIIKITQFVLPESMKKTHGKTFDTFLFGLYTGLRISDLSSLKKEHIKNSLQNGYYIEKEMIKTKGYLYLPIENIYNALALDVPKFNQPIEILNRNIKESESKEYIFNKINYLDYRKLKEIFELAKVNYVGYHGARHGIAMYLINDVGLDITSIGQILGHKNLKTTAIYSRMSNEGLNMRLKLIHNRKEQNSNTNTKAM